MPKWLLIGGYAQGFPVADSTTKYIPPCGCPFSRPTEAEEQFVARDSYTLADLLFRVIENDLNGTTTVKTRKDGGDGNQSVSVLTTETGTFEDTVSSDSLVDGSLFNYQIVTLGSSGEISYTILSCTLETISNTTPILGFADYLQGTGTAAATFYIPLVGGGSTTFTLAEAAAQYTFRAAATLSNLRVYVSMGDIDGATIRTRVNGANGNQSVSIIEATSGAYEDAVNNDSISIGDEVNLQIVTGAGTGGARHFYIRCGQLKSNSTGRQTACADAQPPGLAWNETGYFVIEGGIWEASTEANAQCLTRMAFVAKNFFVNVEENNVDGARTINTRKNGGDGNLSVSVTAATTGIFEDLVNSDTLIATDLYNYKVGTGGSSGITTISIIGFELQQPAAPPVVEKKHTFRLHPRPGHRMEFHPNLKLG